jgi:multiple sugar transport system permease protein
VTIGQVLIRGLKGEPLVQVPGRRPTPWPVRLQRSAAFISKHAVLILLGLAFLFPLFWMVSTSLKSASQTIQFPPVWIPHPAEPGNYSSALTYAPFGTYFANTLFYCATTVIGVTASSSIVAYGFSRIQWRGRNAVFMVLIATMMLPFLVTMIPLFILFKYIGLAGTLWPLIIPTFFGSSAFSTFLLRQFFITIPEALSDAARLDGASEFYIYSKIILPLSRPALATVALFQFIFAWNDFLGPLIYVNSSSAYTVSIGLQQFLSLYGTQWGWLMAASTVVTAPIIILFFFTQRTFIQGISMTGMKG